MLKPINSAIIIGASSGIAKAIIDELLKTDNVEQIVTISQSGITRVETSNINQHHLTSDYSSQSINSICGSLEPIKGLISKVFICNGRLHSLTAQSPVVKGNELNNESLPVSIMPEKRLEDISASAMQALFQSNTIVPMLWLQQLTPLFKGKQHCIISVLSARVGSISDNQLGGWYSYRASKAALNMLINTTAIEYSRRAKNVKLIAFHPGTTDTKLSKPFQANVPEGKLFSTHFVAQQLLNIHKELVFNGKAEFIDWQGKAVSW